MRRRRAVRVWAVSTVLLGLVLFSAIAAATIGPARISLAQSAAILLEALGLTTPWAGSIDDIQRQVVLGIRLPRILCALLIGGALALVGAALQAVLRNPMADPGIIGVSAGAGLGAVLTIGTGLAALHWLVLPGAAFGGALLAAAVVFLFSLRHGRSDVATLLLGGVAVTYLASGATSLVLTLTDHRDLLREMLFWLLGGLDNRGWEHVRLIALPLALGAAVVLLHARWLNLLLLGEEDARSLGVPVGAARAVLLLTSALMTGLAVAVSGPIGFVGLVVPHVARLLVGPDHRALLPAAALGGAWFLLLADTLARSLVQPSELRVGIVTALVGSPFFLFILSRQRARRPGRA